MPDDPIRVADTRAWLIKARKDLRSDEHGLSALPPLLDDVLFHCQQACEKALKGFLTWHDVPFRKTHSLEEIGEQCLAREPALKGVLDQAVPLTEYAWKFRYPGEIDEPTKEEAETALRITHALYQNITSRLPLEAQP